jgi:hypothetical protein
LASEFGNPLGGRPAYGPQNASYPELDEETLDFGGALAGRTIKLRFRLATDEFGSGGGWTIDDIEVAGADNEPFVGLGPDLCEPAAGGGGAGGHGGGPPANEVQGPGAAGDAGCGCRVGSGAAPGLPWYLGLGLGGVLWWLRRGARIVAPRWRGATSAAALHARAARP